MWLLLHWHRRRVQNLPQCCWQRVVDCEAPSEAIRAGEKGEIKQTNVS